jgi:tRNA A-37 threonylcarbamoyl transferase component Bud32
MLKKPQWKTNKVSFKVENGKKLVIKEFDVVKPALLLALHNLCSISSSVAQAANLTKPEMRLYLPSIEVRVNNEIKGREVLSGLGYKTPEIYSHDKKSICMEMVEGVNVSELYKKEDLDFVFRTSEEIGKRVRRVHDYGFAFLDCKSQNLMVKDGEIYHFDLEFFTPALEFQRRCDIVTYHASNLCLDPNKCYVAIEAFHLGYGSELTGTDVSYILLFSFLHHFSLTETFDENVNRTRCAYNIVKGKVLTALSHV